MHPQPSLSTTRQTFRHWIALCLCFVLVAQTTAAMPHSHAASQASPAAESGVMDAVMDMPHENHHTVAHDAVQHDRECCDVECQECAMGNCSTLTRAHGPGILDENGSSGFPDSGIGLPDPLITNLYRPPVHG